MNLQCYRKLMVGTMVIKIWRTNTKSFSSWYYWKNDQLNYTIIRLQQRRRWSRWLYLILKSEMVKGYQNNYFLVVQLAIRLIKDEQFIFSSKCCYCKRCNSINMQRGNEMQYLLWIMDENAYIDFDNEYFWGGRDIQRFKRCLWIRISFIWLCTNLW